ncbi:MAG: hypothetical protein AAFP04_03750 [Myxococcota bacterium]
MATIQTRALAETELVATSLFLSSPRVARALDLRPPVQPIHMCDRVLPVFAQTGEATTVFAHVRGVFDSQDRFIGVWIAYPRARDDLRSQEIDLALVPRSELARDLGEVVARLVDHTFRADRSQVLVARVHHEWGSRVFDRVLSGIGARPVQQIVSVRPDGERERRLAYRVDMLGFLRSPLAQRFGVGLRSV